MSLRDPVEGADASPLRRLGRYEVCRKIAEGGMAAVYVARHVEGPMAGQLVAIKKIRGEYASSSEFVTMFIDEAKIASRLRHPNVVRHLELGSDGGQAYLVMELLFGQSLWSVWDACRVRGRRLDFGTIAWIGARVASGLHYAHELRDDSGRPLDIVHRDVNATNIFVTYDGEIKVIDFGLAKAADRVSKTAAGIVKGKVAYMSPEQAVGAPIDRRSDVFALGTTLWELACDRRLFKDTDDVETLKRVHAAVVPDPRKLVDDFPPDLWRIIDRALARDREKRYANAAVLARDLDAFAAGQRGGPTETASGAARSSLAELMRELFSPGATGNDDAVDACELGASALASAPEDAAAVPVIAIPPPPHVAERSMGMRARGRLRVARERASVVAVSVAVVVVTSAMLLATCATR